MKKMITLWLSLLLILALVPTAAFSQEEPVTFSLWSGMLGSSSLDAADARPNKLSWREAQARTNTEIEFITASAASANEALNLMIVANDLPDAIIWNWPTYPGGPTAAIAGNVLQVLDERNQAWNSPRC